MLKEKGEPNEYACVEVTISCEEIRKNEADGCHGSIVVPLFARRQTTDSSVLKSIFFEGEYDRVRLIVRHGNVPIRNILDAGANAGYSSVLFSLLFPQSKVVGVEADITNYKLLRKNAELFPNIVPVHAALWSKSGETLTVSGSIRGGERSKWAHQVRTRSEMKEIQSGERQAKAAEKLDLGDVETVTVDDLLSKYGGSFDVVKIDIEGAEQQVFSSPNLDWLLNVPYITVEWHDDMRKHSRRTVERAMKSAGLVREIVGPRLEDKIPSFIFSHKGELTGIETTDY